MASKVDYSKYIIPAAVVVGGYFILKNLHLFGGGATDSNNSGISDSTTAGVDSSINQAQAAGVPQTISDSQAAGLAANIYNAGVSDPVDEFTIRNSIIQSNTILDLLKIVKAFGTKQAADSAFSLCGAFGLNCPSYNLNSFVNATLGYQEKAIVNNYLSQQGINYSF